MRVAIASARVGVKKHNFVLSHKFAVDTLIVVGIAVVGYCSYRFVTYLKSRAEETNPKDFENEKIVVRYTIKLCESNKITIDGRKLLAENKEKDENKLLTEIKYATKVQKVIYTIA